MLYPKIQSLYKREGCGPYNESLKRYECDAQHKPRKSKIIEGDFSIEEFPAIKWWTITEKVDGTNCRVVFKRSSSTAQDNTVILDDDKSTVEFGGRTENSQMPTSLLGYLQRTFYVEKFLEVFPEAKEIRLFGEGYGDKIQSGGYYRKDQAFVLFDVWIDGWWLTREGVEEVANKLDINTTHLILNEDDFGNPTLKWSLDKIVDYVKKRPLSYHATVQPHVMEGVIARAEPQMLFRGSKLPIQFKLKCEDFDEFEDRATG